MTHVRADSYVKFFSEEPVQHVFFEWAAAPVGPYGVPWNLWILFKMVSFLVAFRDHGICSLVPEKVVHELGIGLHSEFVHNRATRRQSPARLVSDKGVTFHRFSKEANLARS